MSITLTTQDQTVKDMVANQLASDPELDATLVGVSTKDGIVTLSGYVDTYAAKLAAERAARRVYGVKGIANELEVKLAVERIDPDIAKAAVDALRNRIDVPLGVTVTVRNGVISLADVESDGSRVILSGTVSSWMEKNEAQRAAWRAAGVTSVANRITVVP
jgi:osmotically-inducible protein OsmY